MTGITDTLHEDLLHFG